MTDPKLNDIAFTVFDFETTGLYPYHGDAICEIGAVRMRGGELLETFGTLVRPLRPIPPQATAVNGITDEMVSNAPLIERVFPDFVRFIGDSALVAHNAPFDMGFFATAARQMEIPMPENPIFDTLVLSRLLDPKESSHSLHKLRLRYQIANDSEHRAVDDAVATGRLLGIFIERLTLDGVNTLSKLAEFHKGAFRFETPQLVEKSQEASPEVVEAVRQSVIGRHALRIEYSDHTGALTARVIEPQDIVRRGAFHYLVAHCRLRGDNRTFRLDRIQKIRPDV